MVLNGKDVIVMNLETAKNLLEIIRTAMGDNQKKIYLKLIKKGLLKDLDELRSSTKELEE